jgi:type VI secretion system FHA domain protein
VILVLQITSPAAANVPSTRHVFDTAGGTIGRENGNSWVLPHSKVSGHHARITCRSSDFYIEDTSRNGVFLNSSSNRLNRGEPHVLKSGDRILIEPYEIRVSIDHDQPYQAPGPSVGAHMRQPDAIEVNVARRFDDDPFAPLLPDDGAAAAPFGEPDSSEQLDPLELLNLAPKEPSPRSAPTAKDLDLGSPFYDVDFRPPQVAQDPPVSRCQDPFAIPEGYDPSAPEEPLLLKPSAQPPRATPDESHRRDDVRQLASAPAPPAPAEPSAAVRPHPIPGPVATTVDGLTEPNLGAVLEGAGLSPDDVTPELARTFGQILRVVVTGVMDVMRSRQQVKDEFRMRMTRFKAAENNPLKFSANVDDALHNLLVKRNPAYLPPVEAFEDAFADLRHHQLAMLAGLRTAFESMLAQFDPDRLQQEFDRHVNKGLVPAKLRYWDMFREKRQEIDRDLEASFRRLFGEEFARAYEEQLNRLQAGGDR